MRLLKREYPDTYRFCAYCNQVYFSGSNSKLRGKRVIFPESLVGNIIKKKNEIPLHYTCIAPLIKEIEEYNGEEKESTVHVICS